MSRIIWIGLIVLTAIVALVRNFPLSWAAGFLPQSVGTYSGTYWDGQVRDVPLLGQVAIQGGLSGLTIDTGPGDVTLKADVMSDGATDLILSMPIAAIPTSDNRLSGLDGRISMRLDEIVIDEQTCVRATGQVSTDVLQLNQSAFGWAGPNLSGPVDCEDGRVRVELSGDDENQQIDMTLLTGLDGQYLSTVTVRTSDPSASNVLAIFGFVQDAPGKFTLNEQGRWR